MHASPLDKFVGHLRRLAGTRNADLTDGQLLEIFAAGRRARRPGAPRRALRPTRPGRVPARARQAARGGRRLPGGVPRPGPQGTPPRGPNIARALALYRGATLALRARCKAHRGSAKRAGAEPADTADPLSQLTGRKLAPCSTRSCCACRSGSARRWSCAASKGERATRRPKALGCSVGTVKGRLERGRELLRRRLDRRSSACPLPSSPHSPAPRPTRHLAVTGRRTRSGPRPTSPPRSPRGRVDPLRPRPKCPCPWAASASWPRPRPWPS